MLKISSLCNLNVPYASHSGQHTEVSNDSSMCSSNGAYDKLVSFICFVN